MSKQLKVPCITPHAWIMEQGVVKAVANLYIDQSRRAPTNAAWLDNVPCFVEEWSDG